MEARSPILIALIGVVGGIVGGAISSTADYYLGMEAQQAESLQEARRQAYVEWLTVRTLWREIDDLGAKGKSTEAERLKTEFDRKGRAVMGQIATFGGPRVVASLAEWYRVRGLQPCAAEEKKDLAAELSSHREMRSELLPDEPPVPNSEMAILLFQCNVGKEA